MCLYSLVVKDSVLYMKILFLEMGIVVVKEPKFTPINVDEDIENGVSMEYSKEQFKKMPIRPSAGAGLGTKIKGKILSAKDYLTRGDHDGY